MLNPGLLGEEGCMGNSHLSFCPSLSSQSLLGLLPFGYPQPPSPSTTLSSPNPVAVAASCHLRDIVSILPSDVRGNLVAHGGCGDLGAPSVHRSNSNVRSWANWVEEGGANSEKPGDERSSCKLASTGKSSSGAHPMAGLKVKSCKAKRRVREPRFCFKTLSDVDVLDDGYKWRKYGQKVVKNTQHPRSYYRCTEDNCRVKKRVERLAEDPRMVITTYEGRHAHSPSHEGEESRANSGISFFW